MGKFPFFADGDFVPVRYMIGHKQLWLRNYKKQVEIQFAAVERLELDTRFTGGLTLTPVSSYRDLNGDSAKPLLLLELTGATFGSGFVACCQVRVVRLNREGEEPREREVLFGESAAYSEHAVGGIAAEPGEMAWGRPVLHKYSREKRTTARFPPAQVQQTRPGAEEARSP